MTFKKKKLFNILNHFKFVPNLQKEILGVSLTVLDLGCGKSSPLKFFSADLKYSLGVDSFGSYLEESKKQGIHSDYLQADIFSACEKMADKSFDCVIALDLIEHLTKNQGLKLIREMERLARRKIIIYTPNGFFSQEDFDYNQAQKHLTGWTVEELKNSGFKVKGMSGLKYFRRGFMGKALRPKIFWQFLASASQPLVFFIPQLSHQLLCIKVL